jgi:CHAD domain-containing protein
MIEVPVHQSRSVRSRRALQRAAADRNTQIAAAGAVVAGAALAAGKAVSGLRSDDEGTGPSRRYRLKRKESPPKGVRRIATGRAECALEHLRGEGNDDDSAEAVHETRKDLKKLRALLRLVRDELGDDVYWRENARFRDSGRLLAGARDAEVKLATLDSLSERFDEEFPTHSLRPLKAALESERADMNEELLDDSDGGPRNRAAAEIEAGRASAAQWPLNGGGWKLFAPGLRRAYQRGRSRYADTLADPSETNVHEWRKRVKDLWYQLRILRNVWSGPMDEMADEAHDLADLLGDHHDLAVLEEDLSKRQGLIAKDDLEKLGDLIRRRQKELIESALSLGRRLYAEKPKAFEHRLGEYWAAWR